MDMVENVECVNLMVGINRNNILRKILFMEILGYQYVFNRKLMDTDFFLILYILLYSFSNILWFDQCVGRII